MSKRPGLLWLYAIAIFLGSALLFNVQPMAGRLLLPRFGGSAAVWTTCLVSFQILLLAGYAYAMLLSRFRWPLQAAGHLLLLALAFAWPAFPTLLAIPEQIPGSPVARILAGILAGVGPAYLLLSSGSSLLQSWLARRYPGHDVYRLYAVSNAGSLIGLFAYPFLVEPFAALPVQQAGWRILFGVYAILVLAVALGSRTASGGSTESRPTGAIREPGKSHSAWTHPAWWWILPLVSTFLLVATTTSMTYDTTSLPMVWCFLLGSFLASYIVGFTPFGAASSSGWGLAAICAFVAQAVIRAAGFHLFLLDILVGNAVVLFGGLFLHGWLYRIRPHTGRLTLYYLALAAGGAAGGALASLAAPLVFKGVYEYSLIMIAIAGLLFVKAFGTQRKFDSLEIWLSSAGLVILVLMDPLLGVVKDDNVVFRGRNFYGTVKVDEFSKDVLFGRITIKARSLTHGATRHGMQAVTGDAESWGTTYYGKQAGGYPILRQQQAVTNRPLRVGLVGLGIGTLATYGREGDVFRFFEIDPQIVRVAQDTNLFTYLARSRADIGITLGDARLTLADEAARGEPPWDVLIVDAFSGDSIPLHLLTREAVALFLSRVRDDGLLVFHISNRYIDLLPLLKAQATAAGVEFWAWGNTVKDNPLETSSRWVLLTRQPRRFRTEGAMKEIPAAMIPDYRVVTDEKGSVLPLIDWRREKMARYLK